MLLQYVVQGKRSRRESWWAGGVVFVVVVRRVEKDAGWRTRRTRTKTMMMIEVEGGLRYHQMSSFIKKNLPYKGS